MTQLRDELDECEIGDFTFHNVAPIDLQPLQRLVCPPRYEPLPILEDGPDYEFKANYEFEPAIVTLPNSTATVWVWKRIT